MKMYLYNFIRIFNRAFKVVDFRDKRARSFESELHARLHNFRFTQSKTRIWAKRAAMLVYWYMVYYGFAHYPAVSETPEQANETLTMCGLAFFIVFWVEFKVGISNSPARRLDEVNEDISSGATEWFKMPLPLALAVPVLSFFIVRPALASVVTVVVSLAVFIWLK
jgi:hypothetical protein